jgi:penicillin-binding protein 1A
MMSHVVEEGTARRAQLDGIPAAGKTGTTNAFRDAWFVGYTGNFTAGVWFGNDDYSSTNRMTGGSLPARTWHAMMVAAHQGVEIKDLPGVATPQRKSVSAMTANASAKPSEPAAAPPPVLSKRGADILVRVEKLMDDAAKKIAATPSPTSSAAPPQNPRGAVASAVGDADLRKN